MVEAEVLTAKNAESAERMQIGSGFFIEFGSFGVSRFEIADCRLQIADWRAPGGGDDATRFGVERVFGDVTQGSPALRGTTLGCVMESRWDSLRCDSHGFLVVGARIASGGHGAGMPALRGYGLSS